MSKVNIMQRLSQTLTKMGSGLTQTAMTGIALKSMTNCCGPSIFPMGRGGCCGGGMGYGFGVTSQMMADPMGFSWLPNPACNYAQNNAYGNMMAYQYGLNLAAQSNAQIAANRALYGQQQQLQKTMPAIWTKIRKQKQEKPLTMQLTKWQKMITAVLAF